jgi:ferredoxin
MEHPVRLRVFLPDSLRVVAQRLEADALALRRSFTEPRHTITVPRSGRAEHRLAPIQRHPPVHVIAEKNVGSFRVSFEDGAHFVVGIDESILQAGLRAGLDLDFSCTLGGCGACMLEVVHGEVTYEDREAVCLSDEEIEDGWCLACVGRPSSPLQLRR